MSMEQRDKGPWWQRETLYVGLFLCVLAGLGYGHLLRPGEVVYSRYSDNIAHNLADKQILYDARRRGGGVPLWRSDQLSGEPALTQPQALYTYPFHFLFWWMKPTDALGWTFWLHMLLAGWSFYLLGGVLGLGRSARLLMATGGLFQFKLIMAMFAGWLPTLAGLVLTPLLLVVVLSAIRRPRWESAFWMAGVGGLCLHSGHLQSFYYMTMFLVPMLVWVSFIWWRRGERGKVLRLLGGLGLGALLAVGMALYLLLPLLLEAPMTSRIQSSYSAFLAGHPASWKLLATLFHPELWGTPLDGSYAPIELWEDVAYFGLLPFLLACVGASAGWRRRFVPLLVVGWGVFLFVLPFDSPVLRVFYDWVPGFRVFRSPTRMFFVAGYFGLALAGVGWQILVERWGERLRHAWVWAALAICLVAGEGIWYAHRYLQTVPQERVFPRAALQRFLEKQTGAFRSAPLGRSTFNPGWAAPMGVQLITGYEPYNFSHYQQYFSVLQSGLVLPRGGVVWTDLRRIVRWDLLDMISVRYVLASGPLRLPVRSPLRLARFWPRQPHFLLYGGLRERPLYLYENQYALPRAFWAKEVRCVKDLRAMVRVVEREQVRRVAVVVSDATLRQHGVCGRHVWPHGKIERRTRNDGDIELSVVSSRGGFLLLSEVWHPGWQATLDGREVSVLRANIALFGVWVPAGKHLLHLRFVPMGWPVALWLSGLSLFLWCLGGGWLVWSRRCVAG